jgi:hypothetical protein
MLIIQMVHLTQLCKLSLVLFTLSLFSSLAEAEPKTCHLGIFPDALMDELANIARGEANNKAVDVSSYNGIIAVNFKSKRNRNREIYAFQM